MSVPAVNSLSKEASEALDKEAFANNRIRLILKQEIAQFEKSGSLQLKILKGVSACLIVASMIVLFASTFFPYAWTPWAACGVGLFLVLIKEFAVESRIKSLEKTAMLSKVYLEMLPKNGDALYPIGEADVPQKDPLLKSDKMTEKLDGKKKTNLDFVRAEGFERDIEQPMARVLDVDSPLALKAAASKRYAGVEEEASEWKDVAKRSAKLEKSLLKVQSEYQKAYEQFEEKKRELIVHCKNRSVDSSEDFITAINGIEKQYEEMEKSHYTLKKLLIHRAVYIKAGLPETDQLIVVLDSSIASVKRTINDLNSAIVTQQRQIADQFPLVGLKYIKELQLFYKARLQYTVKFANDYSNCEQQKEGLFIRQLYDANLPLVKIEKRKEELKEQLRALCDEYNKLRISSSSLLVIELPKKGSLSELFKSFKDLTSNASREFQNKTDLLEKEVKKVYQEEIRGISSLLTSSRVPKPILNSDQGKIHTLSLYVSRLRYLEQQKKELDKLWTERKKLYETTPFLPWSHFYHDRLKEIIDCIHESQARVTEIDSVISEWRDKGTLPNDLDEKLILCGDLKRVDICIFQAKQLKVKLNHALQSHPQVSIDNVKKKLEEAQELIEEREKKVQAIQSKIDSIKEDTADSKEKDERAKLVKLKAKEDKGLQESKQTLEKAQASSTELQDKFEKMKDKLVSKEDDEDDKPVFESQDFRPDKVKRKESEEIVNSLAKLDQNELSPLIQKLKRPFDSHLSRFVNEILGKKDSSGVSLLKTGQIVDLPKTGSADTSKESEAPAASKEMKQQLTRNISNINHILLDTDYKYRMMVRLSRVVFAVITPALIILGLVINSPWINLGICAGFFISMAIRQGSAYYLKTVGREKVKEKMQRLLINAPLLPEIPGHRPELKQLKSASDKLGLEGTSMTAGSMVVEGYSTPKATFNKDEGSNKMKAPIDRSDLKDSSKKAQKGIDLFAKNVKKYNDPKVIERMEKEVADKKAGAQARLAIQKKYAEAEMKERVGKSLNSHWGQLPSSWGAPSRNLDAEVNNIIGKKVPKPTSTVSHKPLFKNPWSEVKPYIPKKDSADAAIAHLDALKNNQEYQAAKKAYLEAKKEYDAVLDEPKSPEKKEKFRLASEKLTTTSEAYQTLSRKLKQKGSSERAQEKIKE